MKLSAIYEYYKKGLKKIMKDFHTPPLKFDSTGERVDISFSKQIDFDTLDMYQKNHFKRYEYALDIINTNDICGDFACGTGYGAVMLAQKARKVIGADLNSEVISAIQKRYKNIKNVEFIHADLLELAFDHEFDNVISFETIEHFDEENVLKLLLIFNKYLRPGGRLVISTPYMQEKSPAALALGHHLTFYIAEHTITNWLSASGFDVLNFKYQNYDTHEIKSSLEKKDFIICIAQKRD